MGAVEKKEVIYEFGRFVLNPKERLLLSDGLPIHLPAKEFETLLLLVENNGRALSKEEMIEAVWKNAFVEEGNLAKQISRLRKLFNGEVPAFIETLPKHGYRFSAEVNEISQPRGELILERRTAKSVGFGIENEAEVRPPSALPARFRRFPTAAALFISLFLIAFAVLGFAWFWKEQKRAAQPVESGIVVLTDGSNSDSGGRLTSQGRIYFSRHVTNTRIESWVMDADGTNQRRANTEITNLLNGVWSPDGSKVVFRKDEDDKTVYLADANGANEIVLPIMGGNMDWSPDGSQFVHQARLTHDRTAIFLYTLATGENINLTPAGAADADPSFSYDGKQIAFTSFRDGNGEIYLMNTDGSNLRRLTDHPAFDQYPVFTPDGTAIAFQSNREDDRIEVYLQDLNADRPPKRISDSERGTGLCVKGWSPDGTRMLFVRSQNGRNQIAWAKVERTPTRAVLSDENADLNSPCVGPGGAQILYQARLTDGSIELRLTDLEAGKTQTIYRTAPNYPSNVLLSPALSPDGTRIAFSDRAGGNLEIFVIDIDGGGLRNVTNDPLSDSNPVFSPGGNEIIFVRDFYGTASLYRMDLDGGDQRRLTEKNGHEHGPAFSPDGSHFAFSADRKQADSRGMDIFILDLDSPNNERRLTDRRFHDGAPAFSPDGKRIAFASDSDGNWEIYLINRDGSGLVRLTRTAEDETSPQWSSDGKKIMFAGNHQGKSAIYELEL